MKLEIDSDKGTLTIQENGESSEYPLYSRKAFELISAQWLKVGWKEKYSYTFTWMGCPIIQLPEDMIRIQEVIYRVRPDVLIETGVAHGGSLIFYASLCKALGKGRVVGVDIEIRSANRKAIEAHELFSYIDLIEGSSTDPSTVAQVASHINPQETVMIILDSCHTKAHVKAELEAYAPMVTPGSYLVATDGIMKDLHDLPGGNPDWAWDHPTAAAAEFAASHREFIIEQPAWGFNESALEHNLTYWPGAWLRRI